MPRCLFDLKLRLSQPLQTVCDAKSCVKISLTVAGIFTFLVVEITPVSIKSIGYRTYIYFAGNSILAPISDKS